jgi:transposase
MGKKSDLSPRKIEKIESMLSYSNLKQREIAKIMGVSKQIISVIKKKISLGENTHPNRIGRCGRKKSTTPRIDRRIKKLSLDNRKASCKKISMFLHEEGLLVHRRTVNNRLLEFGLKAYRPRKKPLLKKSMVLARKKWAKEHLDWTCEDWSKVSIFTNLLCLDLLIR